MYHSHSTYPVPPRFRRSAHFDLSCVVWPPIRFHPDGSFEVRWDAPYPFALNEGNVHFLGPTYAAPTIPEVGSPHGGVIVYEWPHHSADIPASVTTPRADGMHSRCLAYVFLPLPAGTPNAETGSTEARYGSNAYDPSLPRPETPVRAAVNAGLPLVVPTTPVALPFTAARSIPEDLPIPGGPPTPRRFPTPPSGPEVTPPPPPTLVASPAPFEEPQWGYNKKHLPTELNVGAVTAVNCALLPCEEPSWPDFKVDADALPFYWGRIMAQRRPQPTAPMNRFGGVTWELDTWRDQVVPTGHIVGPLQLSIGTD